MTHTALIPELYCTDIDISLRFYIETLGFTILYQREEDAFAMLERQGARIMLEQISKDANSINNRSWITASHEGSFGRGVNFQILTDHIDKFYETLLRQTKSSIYLEIENRVYRAGDNMLQQRQFIVRDPDGYMLRFAQIIC